MVNAGEKDCRFQGDGFNSYGEPSILKNNSDTSPSAEVQPTHLLQGRYPRNSPIRDDLETRVDNVQGLAKEIGLKHGGCSYDES